MKKICAQAIPSNAPYFWVIQSIITMNMQPIFLALIPKRAPRKSSQVRLSGSCPSEENIAPRPDPTADAATYKTTPT